MSGFGKGIALRSVRAITKIMILGAFLSSCSPVVYRSNYNNIKVEERLEKRSGQEEKRMDEIPSWAKDKMKEDPEIYTPIIAHILKNTSGDAARSYFGALNSLLKHPEFKEEWIEKYWKPMFDEIVKNTSGEATRVAFRALSYSLEDPKFNERYLPVVLDIARNTSGDATGWAFEALNSLLRNPKFKEEWMDPESSKYIIPDIINSVNEIVKNTSGSATYGAFWNLYSLLEDPKFNERYLPVVLDIARNTSGNATHVAFRAFDFLLIETNENDIEWIISNTDLLFTLIFSTYPASIELGRPIDELHDDNVRRSNYLNGLTQWQVLGLLLSDPEYFFTSSNVLLVERFKNDLKNGRFVVNKKTITDPYELLKELGFFQTEVGNSRVRNLVARLVTYDLFIGENGVFGEQNANEFIKLFLSPIRDLKFDDVYIFLLGNMIERLVSNEKYKEVKETIKTELENALEKATDEKQKRALEFLLVCVDPGTELVDKKRKDNIRTLIDEKTQFKPSFFVSDGKLTVVQVFDLEGTEYHWTETINRIKKYGKVTAEEKGYVRIEGKNVRVILIRGNSTYTKPLLNEAIKKYPKGIYAFRGHSYALDNHFETNVFDSNGGKNIMFFPGSCGGASQIPEFTKKNKSITNFLAYRTIGKGMVSVALIEILIDYYESHPEGSTSFTELLKNNEKRIIDENGDIKSINYGSLGQCALMYMSLY